jgi:hypothetical protein
MQTLRTLFRDRRTAEGALAWLREHGYREDEIGIVLHDAAHGREVSPLFGRSEEQSLGEALPITGATAGISIAAAFAGAVLIVGPLGLLAAGPLALLLGALGAVSAGGIVGVLIGAGIPHSEAERYADELKKGAVLMSVTPHEGDEKAVREVFAELADVA